MPQQQQQFSPTRPKLYHPDTYQQPSRCPRTPKSGRPAESRAQQERLMQCIIWHVGQCNHRAEDRQSDGQSAANAEEPERLPKGNFASPKSADHAHFLITSFPTIPDLRKHCPVNVGTLGGGGSQIGWVGVGPVERQEPFENTYTISCAVHVTWTNQHQTG